MRIWIDFINSPQVSFFEPLIGELTSLGHEFVLTCRDSANTVELIKQRKWSCKIIGSKAEKGILKKLLAFPLRINALYRFLKHRGINVAICQSSFYLPLTSRLLRVPSIYTNDNEHALGNIPAFLFANKIFIPENLSIAKVLKKGARKSKIIQYPGVKEGVYLWPKGKIIQDRRRENFCDKKIYVRAEPTTAEYYSGKLNFLDDFLIMIKKKYSVTVLVRDKAQFIHYSQARFLGIDVPEKPLSFEDIAVGCELFIGAGGSMTREMAIMGIPTISVYQEALLDVDKFLITEKLLAHEPELTFSIFETFIESTSRREINATLIEKGKVAYELFKNHLLKQSRQ
ncbi:DUF354 domain-containing protein [Segetibacter aerophilus]|uniref:DUF354 domain-containing protein n=1 Tax=Segetibacter aerophilus TaxID=670293 RepID=UPI0011BD88B1|nr:DUF354 domain-containing protein [Segetibacter aerophilus]